MKETFPPLVRLRWLLITMRLSASSFAGTARTLVAVGTVSDCSMFLAIAAAAPRSGLRSSPGAGRTGVAVAAVAGDGLPVVGSTEGFSGAGFSGAAVPPESLGALPLVPESVPRVDLLGACSGAVPARVAVVVPALWVPLSALVVAPPALVVALAVAPPFALVRCVGL